MSKKIYEFTEEALEILGERLKKDWEKEQDEIEEALARLVRAGKVYCRIVDGRPVYGPVE